MKTFFSDDGEYWFNEYLYEQNLSDEQSEKEKFEEFESILIAAKKSGYTYDNDIDAMCNEEKAWLFMNNLTVVIPTKKGYLIKRESK